MLKIAILPLYPSEFRVPSKSIAEYFPCSIWRQAGEKETTYPARPRRQGLKPHFIRFIHSLHLELVDEDRLTMICSIQWIRRLSPSESIGALTFTPLDTLFNGQNPFVGDSIGVLKRTGLFKLIMCLCPSFCPGNLIPEETKTFGESED